MTVAYVDLSDRERYLLEELDNERFRTRFIAFLFWVVWGLLAFYMWRGKFAAAVVRLAAEDV
jgi:hypothetical protein